MKKFRKSDQKCGEICHKSAQNVVDYAVYQNVTTKHHIEELYFEFASKSRLKTKKTPWLGAKYAEKIAKNVFWFFFFGTHTHLKCQNLT